jgi:hypothetical protein
MPFLVGQDEHTAGWCGGTADRIDQNIETSHSVQRGLNDMRAAVRRGRICLNKLSVFDAGWRGSCRHQHCTASKPQAIRHSFANSLRAACDEDSFAGEFVHVVCNCGCFHNF